MSSDHSSRAFLDGWLGGTSVHTLLYVFIVVAFCIGLGLRLGTVSIDASAATSASQPSVRDRLNPNTADWQELATLPGIGESLARRIVEHRQNQRRLLADPRAIVFHRASDLEAVKGIGAAKIATLEGFLTFVE